MTLSTGEKSRADSADPDVYQVLQAGRHAAG